MSREISAASSLYDMTRGAAMWVTDLETQLERMAGCSAFQRAYMLMQVSAAAQAKAEALIEQYQLDGAIKETFDTQGA